MSSRQAQRSQTRQRILEAAHEEFATRSYDEVSIQDLVRSAGVARGSFYNHFGDKLTCYRAVCDRAQDLLRDRVRAVRRATTRGESFFRDMAEAAIVCELTEARMILLATDGPTDVRSQFGEPFQQFVREFREDLEDAVDRGVLPDHDAAAVSVAFVGAIQGAGTALGSDPSRLASVLEMLDRMFLAAVQVERAAQVA